MTTFDMFRREFAKIKPSEIEAVVGLAFAQLQIEELLEESPAPWRTVISCPEGAAGAGDLREILRAAESHGVIPDDAKLGEYAKLLADGAYIWRPMIDPPVPPR
jgi:hypothetical protein